MQPLRKTYGGPSKKLKIDLPPDPAILLPGICPKDMKTLSQRDIRTPMFMAAFFTMGRPGEHPVSTGGRMVKKMWPRACYSAIQKEGKAAIGHSVDGTRGHCGR